MKYNQTLYLLIAFLLGLITHYLLIKCSGRLVDTFVLPEEEAKSWNDLVSFRELEGR